MSRIVCLMGKSSSGKDTIYKNLLKCKDPILHKVVPYTTRPIRAGEKEGVEYHFTDEAGYKSLKQQGRIIEERSYETCYGLWRYFTVDDGSICPDEADYLVIGTLDAYMSFRRYYGDDKVLPVLVELDDGDRLARALGRERKQEHPKYEEMCRRFLADAKDFSPEKLREAGNPQGFYNDDLNRCLTEIQKYLKYHLKSDDIQGA